MVNDPVTNELIPTSVVLMFGLLLVSSLGVWVLIVSRLRRREPILAYMPRKPVSWSGWHLLAAFALFIGALAMSVEVLLHLFDLNETPKLDNIEGMQVFFCSEVAGFVLGALGFVLLLRPTRDELGLEPADGLVDISIGLGAFAAIAPFLYGLMWLLSTLDDTQHPIIEWVEQDGGRHLFLLAAASAVLVAPIVEEFLFRVVLQGWLEGKFRGALGPLSVDPPASPVSPGEEFPRPVNVPLSEPAENPYAAPDGQLTSTFGDFRQESAEAITSESSTEGIQERVSWPPIVVSSIVFSLVHYGQGLAPVALFFFALVIGYVYQRTHRVVPCILMHMALNGFSMGVLWFSLGL